MDIQRHLNSEPVVARPPSRLYEFQKTVRRHKFGFAAAAALITVLAVGVLVSTLEAIRATRAEREQSRMSGLAQQAAAKEVQLRQAAEVARQTEVELRQQAEAQSYASDMNLIQQAIEASNFGRARELLNRQRPKRGQPDRRNWEWRYLWQQCQSDALETLRERGNTVGSLAVSSDGTWVAIGDNGNGNLELRNLRDRRTIIRLPAGKNDVRAVFAPQKPLMAYWGLNTSPEGQPQNTIWLWDSSKREVLRSFPIGGPCQGLFFSEDAELLAVATTAPEHQLALWRVSDATKLSSFPAIQPGDRVGTSFATTRDLSLGAHEMPDGWIRVMDLASGKTLWTAKATSDERVLSLAFSPDGRLLASGSGPLGAPIRLWDVRTGKETGRLEGHLGFVGQLVFWPDGKTLASASGDQTIRVWDIPDLRARRILHGHRIEVWRLALFPDNRTLVSGDKYGGVYLWDTEGSLRESARVILPAEVVAWRFSPDSKSIIALDREGRAAEWSGLNFQDTKPLVDVSGDSIPREAVISRSGRLLAVGTTNDSIRVWNLEHRAVTGVVPPQFGPVQPWAFLAEEKTLLVINRRTGGFQIRDLSSGSLVRSWPGPGSLSDYGPCSVSVDEKLCLMFEGGLLREIPTGNMLADLETSNVDDSAFSPDGKLFAAASFIGFARLWETQTRREVATLSGFRGGAHSVAFSPDSARLAVGSDGNEGIKLWDTQSRMEVLALHSQGGVLFRSAFSPDGNLLGAMNKLGALQVWRAPSWAEIEAAEKAQKAAQ